MRSIQVAVVFIATGIVAISGGYTNFNCPTQQNATVLLACVQDCQEQHGADTGICGDPYTGDYHCYCEGRSGRILQRSQLQCKEMNDGYRNLCTHDCVCNHAAVGGHCVWELGKCYCENQGSNLLNVGCPAGTGDEWRSIAKGFLNVK